MKTDISSTTPDRRASFEGMLLGLGLVLYVCAVFVQFCAYSWQDAARRNERDPERAIACIDKSLRCDPEIAESHAYLAAMYQKMATRIETRSTKERLDYLSKAEAAYLKAIDRAPTESSHHMNLGWTRFQIHRAEDRPAQEHVKQSFVLATQLDPYNYYTHYLLATYLLAQDNQVDAFAEFRKTIEAFPNDEVIKKVILTAMEETTEYEKLTQVVPEGVALAHYYFAVILEDTGKDWQGSGKELRQAIRLEPETVYFRDYYFMLCLRHGDVNAAEEEIVERSKLMGPQPMLRYQLAKFFMDTGELSRALDTCDTLLNENPGASEVITLRAEIARRQGNLTEAIRSYENVIEKHPHDSKSYFELARIYGDHGKKFDAAELFAKAAFLEPTNFAYQQALGEAYLQVGMTDRGVEAFLRCKDIDPGNIGPYLRLGELYLTQEKWLDAAQEYAEALKLDPRNQTALKGFFEAQSHLQ